MDDHGELDGRQYPLPIDIIVNILSLLPVKSLMRFKCVSKPWRSLIYDTNFIAIHTKKTVEDRHMFLQRRRVMFNTRISNSYCGACAMSLNENLGLYSINLDQYLHDHADDPYDGLVIVTKIDFVKKESDLNQKKNIADSINYIYFCNNLLLCRVNRRDLYLVNPATRQLKKLPETPTWRPRRAANMSLFVLRGLGFDHTANDYKVIDGEWFENETMVCRVYTLRTDCWKQIEYNPRYIPRVLTGVFSNGAIHWPVIDTHENGAERSVILAFMVAEEEFKEIQHPPTPRTNFRRLGVFRDCLCMTSSGFDQASDEFWVMKEYGVSESWTKISVQKRCTRLSNIGFSTKFHDVIVYKSSLVMYKDFEGEGDRTLRIADTPELGNCVGIYVEGLFPL